MMRSKLRLPRVLARVTLHEKTTSYQTSETIFLVLKHWFLCLGESRWTSSLPQVYRNSLIAKIDFTKRGTKYLMCPELISTLHCSKQIEKPHSAQTILPLFLFLFLFFLSKIVGCGVERGGVGCGVERSGSDLVSKSIPKPGPDIGPNTGASVSVSVGETDGWADG